MKTDDFNKEINRLVGEGITEYEEYNLSAFHQLKGVRQHLNLLQRGFSILIITTVLLLITTAIIFFLYSGNFIKVHSAHSNLKEQSSAIVDTIERLKTENKLLRKKLVTLEEESERLNKLMQQEIHEQESEVVHIFKKGETLYDIARIYYGDGSFYKQILTDNGFKTPFDVKEGTQLKIFLHRKNE